MDENGRVAIISGGAGGIGFSTAEQLLANCVRVVLVDADAGMLDAARLRLGKREVSVFQADATDPEQVAAAIAHAMAKYGRIDILVNIAGGAGSKCAHQIEEVDLETWDSVIELNLRSTFLFTRAAVPIMRDQRYGRVINISSIIAYGEKGAPTTVAARLPYATAKAALLGFTKQLSKDVADHGITVNAVAPGLILGEKGTRIRERFDALPDMTRAEILSTYPIGRPGEPWEVASAIAFLASEGAAFVSGVLLPIDGAYLS